MNAHTTKQAHTDNVKATSPRKARYLSNRKKRSKLKLEMQDAVLKRSLAFVFRF